MNTVHRDDVIKIIKDSNIDIDVDKVNPKKVLLNLVPILSI